MRKSLNLLLIVIICLFGFIGCDNNEGPFEIRKENGKNYLYSNGKYVKGWIENTIYNNDGTSTVVYEIYFEKGLPNGDFKLYNSEGELVVDAKGKWKGSLFKGTIKEPKDQGKGKGEFSINTDFLISYAGENYTDFSYQTLVDGKYEGNRTIIEKKDNKLEGAYVRNTSNENIECNYKNGKLEGAYIEIGPDKTIECNYKNGELDGKCIVYYSDGTIKIECNYKNDKLDGEYIRYYKDGKISSMGTYKDGKLNGEVKIYTGKNGTLEREQFYENDFLVKEKIYYEDYSDTAILEKFNTRDIKNYKTRYIDKLKNNDEEYRVVEVIEGEKERNQYIIKKNEIDKLVPIEKIEIQKK